MKQRKISIQVVSVKSNPDVLFTKDNCSPQDIISALSLFGDDGVRFHIAVDDVDIPAQVQQN